MRDRDEEIQRRRFLQQHRVEEEDQRENGKLMMGGTGLLCSEEIREEELERKPVAGASKRDF